jgi:hypothetical protein
VILSTVYRKAGSVVASRDLEFQIAITQTQIPPVQISHNGFCADFQREAFAYQPREYGKKVQMPTLNGQRGDLTQPMPL